MKRVQALETAIAALGETGIASPGKRIRAFPHEFSGGMLQRAMIAMALMMRPEIVIADEPTTALDVTVQAQLLKLMKDLGRRYGMTIIFITHNLGIVSGFCDRVLVMYAGVVLESARSEALFAAPAHPYTRALLRSVPRLQGDVATLGFIPGAPPDPMSPISGCPFAPRCDFRIPECESTPNCLVKTRPDHATACLRVQRGELQ
jgi:oligopeptide transport system ATP-binding protein